MTNRDCEILGVDGYESLAPFPYVVKSMTGVCHFKKLLHIASKLVDLEDIDSEFTVGANEHENLEWGRISIGCSEIWELAANELDRRRR